MTEQEINNLILELKTIGRIGADGSPGDPTASAAVDAITQLRQERDIVSSQFDQLAEATKKLEATGLKLMSMHEALLNYKEASL